MKNGPGLFPDTRGDSRYAPGTRAGKPKPWEALEDAMLWPVILACESERAYLKTCRVLCEVLGRVPRFADPHPTHAQIVGESVALVEMRTVTRHLSGRPPELFELLGELRPTYRTGLPLTWAEKRRVLLPYHGKPPDDKIQWSVLASLLQRDSRRGSGDTYMIAEYLTALKQKPAPSDDEDLKAINPFDVEYPGRCAELIKMSVIQNSGVYYERLCNSCAGLNSAK